MLFKRFDMATKTTAAKKDFDAAAFMRKQRDKISKDIANMGFEKIKEYFSKKRALRHPATYKKP